MLIIVGVILKTSLLANGHKNGEGTAFYCFTSPNMDEKYL